MYGIDAIAPQPLGPPVDPLIGFAEEDGDAGEPLPSPCPYLIETREGIEVYRHPEAFLEEDDEIFPIVEEFRSGVPKEPARADYFERSAFWWSAWSILHAAWLRKRKKQFDELNEDLSGDESPDEGAQN